jgi:hypothetical protein
MQVQISHEQLHSLYWRCRRIVAMLDPMVPSMGPRRRIGAMDMQGTSQETLHGGSRIEAGSPARSVGAMDLLYRTLKWPVISLLITGATHFMLEAIWPDLRNTFIPPVLAPILLAYGAWVGYRAIGAGGTYLHAIVAAAILGILPIALDIIGFGQILGRGTDAGILSGVFGFAVIVFGSLLGAGFALSGSEASKS